MKKLRIERASEVAEKEWVSLPGGELDAPRPSAVCRSCREKLEAVSTHPGTAANPTDLSNRPLCFACYRAGIERDRKLKIAGELDTASQARFQSALPLEAVNL